MHMGLFVEEMRQGATQPAAFRDVFELADRAEAWGDRLRVAGGDPLHAGALGHLRLAAGGQRHRHPHPPAPRGDRRPGAAPEPPAAHRRGSRDRRSDQRGALRVRDRPQRRRAHLRRLRGVLRREPGPLPRGAGDHPPGLEGRAVQLQGAVLSRRERHGRAPARPGAASADPHGHDQRRDVSRWPAGSACRSSSGCGPRRSPTCRSSWRRTGRPGARPAIPASRASTCASRSTSRRPRRARWKSRARACASFFARQTELARSAVGRAGAGPADRRRMQAERMASLTYDDVLAQEGRVRHRRPA